MDISVRPYKLIAAACSSLRLRNVEITEEAVLLELGREVLTIHAILIFLLT